MDGVSLLRRQMSYVHALFTEAVRDITPGEWIAHPFAGGNALGFIAWHVPAVQDWALHSWMQGVPELRTRLDLAGINPSFAPFGMSQVDADSIGAAVSSGDVLTYADAVLAAAADVFEGLTEASLDDVPNIRVHGTRLPQHRTTGYLAEVDDMYDLPVWRLLAGPCFGHVREHVGEIRLSLQMMRVRP